jgi:hypothetical protein
MTPVHKLGATMRICWGKACGGAAASERAVPGKDDDGVYGVLEEIAVLIR